MSDAEDIIAAFERDVVRALANVVSDQALLQRLVSAAAVRIRQEWAGGRVYIRSIDKQKRDREIVAAWQRQKKRGFEDRAILADSFGVHRSTVNRAISKHLRRVMGQGGFGSDDWNL